MGKQYNSTGRSITQSLGIPKLSNPPNNEIPFIFHDMKQEIIQTHHETYHKFGPTKAGISSTLHTAVRYRPRSLGGIRLFDPFVIQVSGRISFLIEYYWKSDPSSPLLWDDLSTLHLEAGVVERIL